MADTSFVVGRDPTDEPSQEFPGLGTRQAEAITLGKWHGSILNEMAKACHSNSVAKGFWDEPAWVAVLNKYFSGDNPDVRLPPDVIMALNQAMAGPHWNPGEKIALMHSELSEGLEGIRKPQPDQHLTSFPSDLVEMADCVIRIFDYCAKKGYDLGAAVVGKHSYNMTRPYKHGKKF